jgi:hypothetical protein
MFSLKKHCVLGAAVALAAPAASRAAGTSCEVQIKGRFLFRDKGKDVAAAKLPVKLMIAAFTDEERNPRGTTTDAEGRFVFKASITPEPCAKSSDDCFAPAPFVALMLQDETKKKVNVTDPLGNVVRIVAAGPGKTCGEIDFGDLVSPKTPEQMAADLKQGEAYQKDIKLGDWEHASQSFTNPDWMPKIATHPRYKEAVTTLLGRLKARRKELYASIAKAYQEAFAAPAAKREKAIETYSRAQRKAWATYYRAVASAVEWTNDDTAKKDPRGNLPNEVNYITSPIKDASDDKARRIESDQESSRPSISTEVPRWLWPRATRRSALAAHK